MDCNLPGFSVHGDSPRQEYWSRLHSLLQRIFPTQGSNPSIPHCRQSLYHLSHQGRPRILEWVAYPFSSGSSQPRSPTLQADSLPAEPPGKPSFPGGTCDEFFRWLILSGTAESAPFWPPDSILVRFPFINFPTCKYIKIDQIVYYKSTTPEWT